MNGCATGSGTEWSDATKGAFATSTMSRTGPSRHRLNPEELPNPTTWAPRMERAVAEVRGDLPKADQLAADRLLDSHAYPIFGLAFISKGSLSWLDNAFCSNVASFP